LWEAFSIVEACFILALLDEKDHFLFFAGIPRSVNLYPVCSFHYLIDKPLTRPL